MAEQATGFGEFSVLALGPWGGSSGSQWDDGHHNGIQKIHLSHDDTVIGSLQVFYNRGAECHEGKKNISSLKGFHDEHIKLHHGERIVKVSGNIGLWPVGSKAPKPVVRSLTFETDLPRTFGPYGIQSTDGNGLSADFNVLIQDGFVSGFKGSSDDVLDAIGFYISPK